MKTHEQIEETAAVFAQNMQKSLNEHLGHEVIPAWGPVASAFESGYTRAINDVVAMLKEDYPADSDGPYRCGAWFANVIKHKFLRGEK